ncbi:hypothetical protein K6959_05895 [Bacillus aquiflavi]|uniref:hypothetical protein n=1 Tax=Bacillus aquiflavi TaxID=2672567 RepID=UPI001CA95B5F|nr:hypothetical protein [Bacillus aquiflavi]UAC49379.1 hypothetical protein K6959_05895 [Bacillus aquiflavi]
MKKNEKELATIEKKITDSIAKEEVEKARKEISKHDTADDALTELVKQTNELQLKELKEKEKGEELQKWQQQLDEAGLSELSKAIEAKDTAQVENELEKN